MLAVPLIVRDGIEFRFIHRSIGEFFAAEFLAHQPNADVIITRIRDGHLNKSFIDCFQYLSDINPGLLRRLIVAPLATIIVNVANTPTDPRIRSLAFLVEAAISLWPLDNVKREGVFKIPNDKAYREMWYSYGKLQGTQYVMVLGISREARRLPEAAWLAITTPFADRPTDEITGDDFDAFGSEIPFQKWIPILDPAITKIGHHKAISETIERVLSMKVSNSEDRESPVRLISVDACKAVLLAIEEETKTHGWLENLVEGPILT